MSVAAKKTPAARKGDVFVIDVKFRQNATWQGTVRHNESGQEMSFRSALELLKMMDDAMDQSHPRDGPVDKKDVLDE